MIYLIETGRIMEKLNFIYGMSYMNEIGFYGLIQAFEDKEIRSKFIINHDFFGDENFLYKQRLHFAIRLSAFNDAIPFLKNSLSLGSFCVKVFQYGSNEEISALIRFLIKLEVDYQAIDMVRKNKIVSVLLQTSFIRQDDILISGAFYLADLCLRMGYVEDVIPYVDYLIGLVSKDWIHTAEALSVIAALLSNNQAKGKVNTELITEKIKSLDDDARLEPYIKAVRSFLGS